MRSTNIFARYPNPRFLKRKDRLGHSEFHKNRSNRLVVDREESKQTTSTHNVRSTVVLYVTSTVGPPKSSLTLIAYLKPSRPTKGEDEKTTPHRQPAVTGEAVRLQG